MNPHFRDSLWHYESGDAEVRRRWEGAVREAAEPIPAGGGDVANLPYHLLTVFTQLSLSRRSFVDPLALINRLGISHTDQQDAHEFRTYLMQALQDALAASTFTPHHTLLQTLFEGRSKSILRCSICGHRSCNEVTFVDLGVSIKGKGSVYAGVQSLVEQEWLDEANAVYCSQCRVKQSMAKHMEYSELPPYLNVQLMRFELVFQGNAVKKKKVGEKVYIPEKINFRHCLALPGFSTFRHVPSPASMIKPPPSPVNAVKEQTEEREGTAALSGGALHGSGELPAAVPPPALLPRLEAELPLLPPPPPLSEMEAAADVAEEKERSAEAQPPALEEAKELKEAPESTPSSKRRRKAASVVSHPKRSRAKPRKAVETMDVDDSNGAAQAPDLIDIDSSILSTPPPAKRSAKKGAKKRKGLLGRGGRHRPHLRLLLQAAASALLQRRRRR